jgi:hypothetical protein
MKVLTLTQPWATLVAIGAKRIETRSWSTNYRGPLAIHAAKGFPKWAQEICFTEPFATTLRNAGFLHTKPHSRYGKFWKETIDLPRAAIVATCDLVTSLPVERFRECMAKDVEVRSKNDPNFYWISHEESAFGDYFYGRRGWILANVKMLETPIPAKGALGLWSFDLEAAAV